MTMWTDERIADLKRMWSDGATAATIADTLGGVTRNSVLGKIHRLGLSGFRKVGRPTRSTKTREATPPRKRSPAPRAVRPASSPGPARRESPEAGLASQRPAEAQRAASTTARETGALVSELCPPGGLIGIFDLTARTCRWPIGDPRDSDFGFCGREKPANGRPYCEQHARNAGALYRRRETDEQRERRMVAVRRGQARKAAERALA